MSVEIQTTTIDDEILITVKGEVDLYSSPELRTAILDAVPAAAAEVAVDLSGVDYIDSSGVATLVEGLKSAREHDKKFVLVKPAASVRQVLELARLDSIFEVKPTS